MFNHWDLAIKSLLQMVIESNCFIDTWHSSEEVNSRPWVNNEIKSKEREQFKAAQISNKKLVGTGNNTDLHCTCTLTITFKSTKIKW